LGIQHAENSRKQKGGLPHNAGDTVSRETRLARPTQARQETAYFPINAPLPLTMSLLNELPGLGPRSLAMLAAAGITDRATLERRGTVRAYLDVKRAGQPATLNLLWALEGALTHRHWQEVARQERTRLLLSLDAAQQAPQE
jgi:DNA transformation protein